MRMEKIEFKDALQRLAEKAGFNTEFVLRDIKTGRIDENFSATREKIENVLHRRAKEVYRAFQISGILPKRDLFITFDTRLWHWYDEQQKIFDAKFLKGMDVEILINALYRFQGAFLNKLRALEEILNDKQCRNGSN